MELNQNNYENYLLLYIDNELTASERAEVELFLASNPKKAQELKALQAVQLKPEYVEFTEKSSLYRFEEMNAFLDPAFKKSLYKNNSSSAKLIDIKKIYWATGSIAAIALGIFFGIKTLSNQPVIHQEQASNEIVLIRSNTPNNNTTNSNNKALAKENSNQTQVKTQDQAAVAQQTQPFIAKTASQDQINLQSDAIVNDSKESIVALAPNPGIGTVINSIETGEQKIEKEIFEEINTEDNNRVIYISNIELDGDKFRGITRRLSVLFKRNKTEKNK